MIVTSSAAATRVIQQQTQTIPIVFTAGGDPAANGMVRNIARPEGNTTGFSTNEPSEAGKWLGLLKEAAPNLARVAVIFNPEVTATGPSYIASIEAAAPALAVQAIIKMPVRNAVDIVRGIDELQLRRTLACLCCHPLSPATPKRSSRWRHSTDYPQFIPIGLTRQQVEHGEQPKSPWTATRAMGCP